MRRLGQAQRATVPAAQPAHADMAGTAKPDKTAGGPSDEAVPGGTPGRIVISPAPDSSAGAKMGGGVPRETPVTKPPSQPSFPTRSTAGTGRLVTRPGQRLADSVISLKRMEKF